MEVLSRVGQLHVAENDSSVSHPARLHHPGKVPGVIEGVHPERVAWPHTKPCAKAKESLRTSKPTFLLLTPTCCTIGVVKPVKQRGSRGTRHRSLGQSRYGCDRRGRFG